MGTERQEIEEESSASEHLTTEDAEMAAPRKSVPPEQNEPIEILDHAIF